MKTIMQLLAVLGLAALAVGCSASGGASARVSGFLSTGASVHLSH